MSDPFTFRIAWSEDDREYVGLCDEFPSLSHLACSKGEALDGITSLVRSVDREFRLDKTC